MLFFSYLLHVDCIYITCLIFHTRYLDVSCLISVSVDDKLQSHIHTLISLLAKFFKNSSIRVDLFYV